VHPKQTFSDIELVARSLQNPDNYAELVERYEAPLLRYIARISNVSKAEAEDLLQNVFLKAYQNLNDFDPKLKFSSWIYRIAHNEVVSNWRRKSARASEVQLEDADAAGFFRSAFDLQKEVDEKILAARVREVLTKLPKKYQEVLILRYIEDKDYNEISDILRKPGGTVATLLNRAKKDFKKRWSKIIFDNF
jgi:RNA polymerase sigma-70 factor (ECF subfamily)